MESQNRAPLQLMALLERNVGLLYSRFSTTFPEDREFWQSLAFEEERHASLVETHFENMAGSEELSNALAGMDIESIASVNKKVEGLIGAVGRIYLLRIEALTVALQIEQAAGESHYQAAATAGGKAVSISVFRDLNLASKDHAKRIMEYIEKIEKRE